MPADESTSEVGRLLEEWDSINRRQLPLSAILAADSVLDMASADGDTHLVAVLARLWLYSIKIIIVYIFCSCNGNVTSDDNHMMRKS